VRWQETIRTMFAGGTLSSGVFPAPPLVPAVRRLRVYITTSVRVACQQVADAPVPLVVGAAAMIGAIHRAPVLHRGALLSAATTLLGLLAVAVAALTAIARDYRAHRRWVRMVFSETWLPLVLTVNGLLIVVAMEFKGTPSPIFAIIAWSLLVRALWVSLTLLDQTTAAARLERAAYAFYQHTAVRFDQQVLPFGRIGYQLRGAFGLRWRLAEADAEWSALHGPNIYAAFSSAQPHLQEVSRESWRPFWIE